MTTANNKRGGKRPGAGRKSKAEELGLVALLDSTWPIPKQKLVLKKLADDCGDNDFHTRHEARKLLLAYKFGKPTESVKHSGDPDNPIENRVVVEFVKANDSAANNNTDKG